ncbi:MAG: DEAD/DEAH box helicase family protein [Methanobrevibacter arboriphilus]|uniref:DEAD/DEAH box helicase family protein n=1 Tax=Methanobrevibacter arboriphilus TaxID=39441 RepID=A0A843A9A2_METAZ|nr:DEAD/DEAH box helicase family protein [Methanobrevibacter arboriphilus]MBF4467877.1 DEAD/DEAH box helicase family protein [Methanobrevibacter arboriphilus]
MVKKGTGSNPLEMAKVIAKDVEKAWEDGSFLKNVSPVTQDLLKHWFFDAFADMRHINFHKGQKRAILNIIYLHEVLKIKNVKDLYLSSMPELLQEMDLEDLSKEKYQHPMYAVKMATGTGKTWVLHAILIWQYLNAKLTKENVNVNEDLKNLFSKNFLIVAPGLIVYNRLLDAFLGSVDENGNRDFENSDFNKFKELFIPPAYRETFFSFIQSSVATKEEISSKVTGDGLIAITNWHLLAGIEENETIIDSPLDNPHEVYKKVFPISPGTSNGNSLDSLDNNFLKGKEINYLAEIENLVVFNDEAHHIHENKKKGEISEVEWQKSLNYISKDKEDKFIRIDFSATPYVSTGKKAEKRGKHYFPHIIADYDLKNAIHDGYVKMIAIDERKEIGAIKDLDFKAIRDGNKVIGLSEGQKIMLKAGLTKLNILEKDFIKQDKFKHPKMFVICEDTKVPPFVKKYLIEKGLKEEDILEIHSNKKGEVSNDEWDSINEKLFNIDDYESPKVIISVLMLREGFDVNNICVVVPLRSTNAPILLEQTIGRGLRLMWREPAYLEEKKENRKRVLVDKKEPLNYLDLLSIIEHPNFISFYENLGEVGIDSEGPSSGKTLGNMIVVNLKENYQKYDFYWPIILREREEILTKDELSLGNLEPFNIPLSTLLEIKGEKGDTFVAHELTVGTKFGKYNVESDLFNAQSYNEFIVYILNSITNMMQPIKRTTKQIPMIQINNAEIIRLVDDYIRTKLFNTDFNPLEDENWRILYMSDDAIIKHIIKQFSQKIYDLQHTVEVKDAEVDKIYFSQIEELKMRENYSIDVSKSIYEKLPYPSNKGGFEKLFIEKVDLDAQVDSFIKINEYYHSFASILYIREDGLIARYYPDFLVKIEDNIYVVETKADKDISSENVQRKRIATIEQLNKFNQLKSEDRMDSQWIYVLLGEKTFKNMMKNGASIKEILDYTILTEAKAKGTLDDYL